MLKLSGGSPRARNAPPVRRRVVAVGRDRGVVHLEERARGGSLSSSSSSSRERETVVVVARGRGGGGGGGGRAVRDVCDVCDGVGGSRVARRRAAAREREDRDRDRDEEGAARAHAREPRWERPSVARLPTSTRVVPASRARAQIDATNDYCLVRTHGRVACLTVYTCT